MPKVYLIDNPQPNAFATGRNPQNAAVAATTGLLERLSHEEVAGVMAHELAHVQHRDTLTMTITATLAGAISMLGNFAFFFGGNRDNNNPLGFIGVLVAMIVAPLAAMLVQMAISRTREYAADRRGAEICGKPLWLASALDKIARDAPNGSTIPTPSAIRRRRISSSSIRCRASAWTICSRPIPNTENRIAALQAMAREVGGDDAGAAGDCRSPPQSPVPRRRNRRPMGPQSDRGHAELQGPLGPQSDRTQGPMVVSARPVAAPAPPIAQAAPSERSPGLAARKAAAKLLAAVIDARTPLDGLTDHEHGHPQFRALDMRDRALVRAILVTALRYRGTIARLIARAARAAAAAERAPRCRISCMSAAAQILFLDVPDSAAVDLAVTHAKADPRTARFSGLVNGVLRAHRARQGDDAAAGAGQRTTRRRNGSATGWPPPMARRRRRRSSPRTGSRRRSTSRSSPIPSAGPKRSAASCCRPARCASSGSPRAVAELPGFAEGAWWVQDAAASLPARLLGDVAGLRVADLCAAPGGKTAQLAAGRRRGHRRSTRRRTG